MGLRGHIEKIIQSVGGPVLCLVPASAVLAGSVNWNVTGSGTSSDSLTNTANWTGGFPANGSNVFMVWTRTTAGPATKTVTNSANQFFFADSLTITNQASKDTVF